MKKTIRLFTVALLSLFALVVIVTSCKKDEASLSKKEMLTAKSWKISSSKTNGVVDVIEDCGKDDFLTFASNGTYTFNPGTIKCFSDDSTDSGTWALSSDEKYITVDGESAILVELTPSRFTVSITVVGEGTYEVTYISF